MVISVSLHLQRDNLVASLINDRPSISRSALQIASRPRMQSDNVFEKAARLIQDGGDGPAVRRE